MPVIRRTMRCTSQFTLISTGLLLDPDIPHRMRSVLINIIIDTHEEEITIGYLRWRYNLSLRSITTMLNVFEKAGYLFRKKIIHPKTKRVIRHALYFYESPKTLRILLNKGKDICPQPRTKLEAKPHIEIARREKTQKESTWKKRKKRSK